MRFLDRPKTAGPSLARAPALYQSVPAGSFLLGPEEDIIMTLQVSAHLGPKGTFFKNAKLCQGLQEQHTSPTNARGTTALNTFTLGKGASCVLSPANLGWVGDLSFTSRRILGSRARLAMRGWAGVAGLPRHQARGNPIGLQEINRLKVDCVHFI